MSLQWRRRKLHFVNKLYWVLSFWIYLAWWVCPNVWKWLWSFLHHKPRQVSYHIFLGCRQQFHINYWGDSNEEVSFSTDGKDINLNDVLTVFQDSFVFVAWPQERWSGRQINLFYLFFRITFFISSWVSDAETHSTKLFSSLTQTLDEMKTLLENNAATVNKL